MKNPLSTLLLVIMAYPLYAQSFIQTQSDDYTRYELGDPASHAFRIYYDVSATTAGAELYFNTLRRGSEHMVHDVTDLMTGEALDWNIVAGEEARSKGHANARDDTDYLMVSLARKVPHDGEVRLRIDKTYQDTASYFETSGHIIFSRSLGIKRNAVVLPPGYELVACNYPSQVRLDEKGRLCLSFMNRGSQAVNYRVEAKPLDLRTSAELAKDGTSPWPDYQAHPQGRDKSKARLNYSINERAFQDREIVYFLQQPETHSFRLYHDYTESRVGRDKYLNVVREGSRVSNPSAYLLDTGEALKVETLKGQSITEAGIDIGSTPGDDTEVVVIRYPEVKPNTSVRLRIWETYTDPSRYLIYQDELLWDRSFGRNRNAVVLPSGWWLTISSIPAVISETADGLTRLDYVNDRPDNIDVLLRARPH